MREDQWMLEDKFRRRTAELLMTFQRDVEAIMQSGPVSAELLARLNGTAKSTIGLLRENKTNSVRTQQAQPNAIDYAAVNAEIDSSIQQVFTTKATWRTLQARAVAAELVTGEIDLTTELVSLAELHREGELSDEEFLAAKARLLL